MSERLNLLIKILSLLFVTVLLISNSFFFDLSPIYYSLIFILLIIQIFLSTNGIKSIDFVLLVFVMSCLFSIALNDVPGFFQPYTRFIVFSAAILLLTNFIESIPFNLFRSLVFKHLLKFNVWICILSVILMLLGLHAGKKIDHYNNLRPDFAGLYRHSMVLSAMSGIAILTLINDLRKSENRKFKFSFILGIVICFIGLIQSGSRAAIAGLLLAIIVYFFILYRNRLHRFVSILFLFSFITVISFPLWEKKADFVMSKFNSKSSDLQYGSRDIKWNQRLREFSSSPIVGIGFASVDIRGEDDFNMDNGIIEPGTSWLAVLSMTGLLGFVFFAANNFKAILTLLKDKSNENNIFILSCLILMLFYMLFEGIVFASGTLLFAFYWLMIGQINVKKSNT